MNEDTRFILKRMEALEGRIMAEIKELQAWKNKVIGTYLCLSVITSLVFHELVKLF